MEKRRFDDRGDDEDVHRAMGRQAGGTDAVREPHAAENFHGAGIAPLHLGKELRRFLLLDERAAHAAQPEIDREGQPDRARADYKNLGVDHGKTPSCYPLGPNARRTLSARAPSGAGGSAMTS